MAEISVQQRCWNHEAREAVCRCPECGRCFCRECVTEHETRLLCASCIAKAARRPSSRSSRGVLTAAMLVAGLALTWTLFFVLGEGVAEYKLGMERIEWQNR
jgi:hypothetical protein